MVTQVTKFITEDGKEFTELGDAEKHEATYPLVRHLDTLFDDYPRRNVDSWDDRYVTNEGGCDPFIYTHNLGKFLVANLESLKKVFNLLGPAEVGELKDAAYAQGRDANTAGKADNHWSPMKIRELILGPNGLLKSEIHDAQFERIYYGALGRALGLGGEVGYDSALDERVQAHLVSGTIINSKTFIFRGTIVYTFDDQLLALSWKNCGPCPTRIAFFKDSRVGEFHALLLQRTFPMVEPLNLVTLNDPFTPQR